MAITTSRLAPHPGISIFFVLYWALLLPFICWGAWATPGHPHARPHLVFAMPEHTAQAVAEHQHAMGRESMQDLTRCDGDVMPLATGYEQDRSAQMNPCQIAPGAADVAGQSLPSTLAATILVVVASVVESWKVRLLLQSQIAKALQLTREFALLVPTPPPRIV